MPNPPAFQHFAADFFLDTIEWSIDELGIYLRLLEAEWVNGDLTTDLKRLARIAGCSEKRFQKGWHQVKSKFTLNGQNRLVNRRLEKVRKAQDEYRKQQAESGLRGIEIKKKNGIYPFNKSSNPSSDPSSNPSSERQALQSSSSIKEKNPKKELFQMPTKEEVNESSIPKIKEDLEKVCNYLYETKKFLKVHAFKNKMLKEGRYERAILHTLIRCSLKDDFEDTPWGYCIKIIEVENGNYNEYEYRKDKG